MLSRIQLLALDFDGVLTDNRVWISPDGHESVACSRADSWGITKLKEAGIDVVVISTETNPVVQARCNKMGFPCISGCNDKADALSKHAKSLGIPQEAVAFVGNDSNDRAALEWAGVPILVADTDSSLSTSDAWVLQNGGGKGAIREVCDGIIRMRMQDDGQ